MTGILGVLGLVVAGCAQDEATSNRPIAVGGASGTERAAVQVLHKGNGAEPQTLDPHKSEGVPASNILRDLFEGLTIEAPNGDLMPGAAESWEISADGLVYTFKLRAGARWSNGDPVTAADFAYGLRRSVDPKTLSRYTAILKPIANAEQVANGALPVSALGVQAVDDHTLEIRLASPAPYFLGLLNHSATYPVHRASAEQHGDRYARPGNLVGNGAYRLAEWTVQSHIKLVRNAHYWDDADTTIDEVYYYPLENQAAELKRYRADELDFTNELPYKQLTWIRENLADELVLAPYLGSYYYGLNITQPPFKDNLKLRQALALAVDRDIITRQVTGAGEIPAYGWVPPVNNYQSQRMPGAELSQAEREVRAKQLYAEAGYGPENPLTVEFLYNTHQNHKSIGVAVASMWKTVLGVETRLINQEWKVFLEARRKKTDTQVFRGGWIGDYNDAFTFAELLHSENAQNDAGYANPEYDRLLQAAARERDLARRAELLQSAEAVLLADQPLIPIYFYVTKRLVKPWVGGFQPNIMDHHYTKDMFILAH
jgi:oligopeptide transport system substrate-binding protein